MAEVVLVIFTVPPMKALPANPKPPVTISAPDVVEVELVGAVTAKPDTFKILAVGLKPNVDLEESATPEPVPCGVNTTGL